MKTFIKIQLFTLFFVLSGVVLAACNNPANKKPISENSSETFQSAEDKKGELLYENKLGTASDVKDWVLEGPAKIEFKENWMHLFSPDEDGHHVFWCPEDFPSDFIVEWELQNQETDAGLCIIFFSALGNNGESIFDPSFPKRDGVFKQYTKSKHFNN